MRAGKAQRTRGIATSASALNTGVSYTSVSIRVTCDALKLNKSPFPGSLPWNTGSYSANKVLFEITWQFWLYTLGNPVLFVRASGFGACVWSADFRDTNSSAVWPGGEGIVWSVTEEGSKLKAVILSLQCCFSAEVPQGGHETSLSSSSHL